MPDNNSNKLPTRIKHESLKVSEVIPLSFEDLTTEKSKALWRSRTRALWVIGLSFHLALLLGSLMATGLIILPIPAPIALILLGLVTTFIIQGAFHYYFKSVDNDVPSDDDPIKKKLIEHLSLARDPANRIKFGLFLLALAALGMVLMIGLGSSGLLPMFSGVEFIAAAMALAGVATIGIDLALNGLARRLHDRRVQARAVARAEPKPVASMTQQHPSNTEATPAPENSSLLKAEEKLPLVEKELAGPSSSLLLDQRFQGYTILALGVGLMFSLVIIALLEGAGMIVVGLVVLNNPIIMSGLAALCTSICWSGLTHVMNADSHVSNLPKRRDSTFDLHGYLDGYRAQKAVPKQQAQATLSEAQEYTLESSVRSRVKLAEQLHKKSGQLRDEIKTACAQYEERKLAISSNNETEREKARQTFENAMTPLREVNQQNEAAKAEALVGVNRQLSRLLRELKTPELQVRIQELTTRLASTEGEDRAGIEVQLAELQREQRIQACINRLEAAKTLLVPSTLLDDVKASPRSSSSVSPHSGIFASPAAGAANGSKLDEEQQQAALVATVQAEQIAAAQPSS